MEVISGLGEPRKNIQGKKTDVLDCVWILKLHTLGLLRGSFLPDHHTEQLRTLCRHRHNLIHNGAKSIKRMSQNLRLMNLRLDVVVNDLVGLAGLKIIEAVCNGESDAHKLAALRHANCRKSKEEIAKGLQSNGGNDYLFALKQEYAQYQYMQNLILDCDEQIKIMLNDWIDKDETKKSLYIAAKVHNKINKNTPKNIDLNLMSYQFFDGLDLYAIEGFSHGLALTIISELGEHGIQQFPSAQHFASWLRLSPNNKISGAKYYTAVRPKEAIDSK